MMFKELYYLGLQSTEQIFLVDRNRQLTYKLLLISTLYHINKLRYLNSMILWPRLPRTTFATVTNLCSNIFLFVKLCHRTRQNTKEIAGKKNSRRTELTKATWKTQLGEILHIACVDLLWKSNTCFARIY